MTPFIRAAAVACALPILACAKSASIHLDNQLDSYVRFPLSLSSTQDHPYYFYCTVTKKKGVPIGIDLPRHQVRVVLVDYAQMISRFSDVGILDTNASVVNHYAMASYHEPKAIYKNTPGFVDAFVAWPNYKVTCASGKGGRPLIPTFG